MLIIKLYRSLFKRFHWLSWWKSCVSVTYLPFILRLVSLYTIYSVVETHIFLYYFFIKFVLKVLFCITKSLCSLVLECFRLNGFNNCIAVNILLRHKCWTFPFVLNSWQIRIKYRRFLNLHSINLNRGMWFIYDKISDIQLGLFRWLFLQLFKRSFFHLIRW